MYKVLIIDDEEPLREAVKILGEWDKLGIEEIIEASDGRIGIRLMEERKPDIVLVDMKMPEINGIEFLQMAEKEHPETQYIVISGYDNFEFTRQAVKSKAVDYLMKPVNKVDLNNALTKAMESIKENRKKKSEIIDRNIKLNMSLPSLKGKIFLSAIEGNLNKNTYEDYIRTIGVSDEKKNFAVAVLRVLNLDDVNSKFFSHDVSLLFFALTNVINEICDNVFECFSIRNSKSENEIIIIIINEGVHKEEIKYSAYGIMMRVIRKLEDIFGIIAVVGIGGFCSDFIQLAESYKIAQKFLDSINLLEMRECVLYEDSNKKTAANISILSKKSLIENAIEGGSYEYTRGIVSEYMNKVVASGYFSLRNANEALNEIVLILSEIALEKGIYEESPKDDENSLKSSGISFSYSKFDEFRDTFYKIVDFFYFKIIQQYKSSVNFDIHEIRDYIERNYFKEIKISMFTEKYFLSREYLMKLFKKEYGCGIYEYALKIRMEKAKELMSDPKIKIQDIGQMMGYNDNNYFSKAYKNYYGISPSDYRAGIIKSENNDYR